MRKFTLFLILYLFAAPLFAQQRTYAERLGWPKGARVLILHIDDAGMSHESNQGVEKALSEGVPTSTSVMMPCSWVPEFKAYLDAHAGLDAGLHLTLTSEWEHYRWSPVAGILAVPGLTDRQGCLWSSVEEVVLHASPEEIDREIRAQYQKALHMGFIPTHLDSHMGTLFASEAFLEKYLKLGIEKKIPVMFPGGQDMFYRAEAKAAMIADLRKKGLYKQGMIIPEPAALSKARATGEFLWKSGLPVLDDLHNSSYDWNMPGIHAKTNLQISQWYTDQYIASIGRLSPGLTMVIMHCTLPSDEFKYITDSGLKRKGDLLAMLDPRLKAFLTGHGYILTTWAEVMERRKKAGINE